MFKSTKYPARAPGDKNKWLHLPDGKWLHSHPKSQEYPNGSAEPLSPTGTTSAEPAVAHSETETANANSDAAANEHLEGSQLDIPRVNSDPERGNESEEEEEVETPQLTVSLTVALLVSVTVVSDTSLYQLHQQNPPILTQSFHILHSSSQSLLNGSWIR